MTSVVTIDSNRAGGGGGGGVCVIADSQLASAASDGRISASFAASGPALEACIHNDKGSSIAAVDATMPFMVLLLTGTVAMVSPCSGIHTSSCSVPPSEYDPCLAVSK